MRRDLIRISKFLSLVLRHKPETIGLALDSQGWVEVDELLRAANAHGRSITREQFDAAVATNDKKRFVVVDGRVRASQGHSLKVELDLEPLTPPEVLYHGTATRFLESILEQGLKSMSRQHVHLSAEHSTAVTVGRRHGKAVVLQVLSAKMAADGFLFYRSLNGVWLTERVPPNYLQQEAE